MANCVDWEWRISAVEYLTDGNWGDVVENDFADKLSEWYGDEVETALRNGLDTGVQDIREGVDSIRLSLSVRRWESAGRELTIDIDEAYVLPNWTLPEETEGGVRIPKKVHRELAKAVENIKEN